MKSSAPCPLGITISRRGDTTVVLLRGELDLAGEDRLRSRLRAVLADRPQTLVLELSGLEFLDCTGLSVMMWTRNHLHQRGAALQIRNPRPAVRRVLALGALTRHMPDPT
jgi:anti-sigma B factor antagonist